MSAGYLRYLAGMAAIHRAVTRGDAWAGQARAAAGFLRALYRRIVTTGEPRPYRRPRRAAERTISRRRAAGTRRARRYGVRPRGPAGRPSALAWMNESPFSVIERITLDDRAN